jgi:hypothetical protein
MLWQPTAERLNIFCVPVLSIGFSRRADLLSMSSQRFFVDHSINFPGQNPLTKPEIISSSSS